MKINLSVDNINNQNYKISFFVKGIAMKIGIKEIAEKAGVSVAAVSLALNNKQGVGKDTRDRIIESAKKLGYPALSKANLGDDQNTIRFLKISRHGHTVNVDHEYFIADYLNGVMDSAKLHNMVVEIESYGHEVAVDEIIEKIESTTNIDGYVVLATELNEEDIKQFLATGKKIVFIDAYIFSVSADYVNMNNMDAVYKVVSYLKDLKHVDIGMLKSSISTGNFTLRERAFYRSMEALGVTINKDYILDVDSTFAGAYEDMKGYLDKGIKLPTAVFAINDIIALGAMKALSEKDIKVPDELSIVAFDNLSMSEVTSPPLTSVNVPKRQIGQVALDMLYLKLNHPTDRAPMVNLISTEIIKRGSATLLNK